MMKSSSSRRPITNYIWVDCGTAFSYK
jgi:hypothetical protein